MPNSSDKHFVQNWKDQREGPKWKYYLQYIIAWSVVIFLVLFFILKLFMEDRSMGGTKVFYIIACISFVAGVLTTHIIYTTSESRYQKILEKDTMDNDATN